MKDVAGFAGTVPHPIVFADFVVEIVHIDPTLWGIHLCTARGNPDDANAISGGVAGRLGENRMEQLGEEEGSHVVGAELHVIALLCLAALWGDHDASVVPQNVEAVILTEKIFGRGFDGCQVVKVEMEIYKLAL